MRKAVWTGMVLAACMAFSGSTLAAEAAQKPQKKAQKRVELQFKKLDADHNGSIARTEWKGRAKAFDRLDADHNGSLSLQELARITKARKRKV